ncbi:MAG: helix-turn-helix transcriptional regulator [Ktedonobacteraceae bacterium]|nr:helix-turn-helix transcriptional regulator [Ktedonobacteraceae bacterium]
MREVGAYRLRKAREDFDITQEDLAVATGSSSKTISRAEKGEPVSLFIATQICEYFSKLYHRQIESDELGLSVQRKSRARLGHTSDISDTTERAINHLLQPLAENCECAWSYPWNLGEEVSNIKLIYDSRLQYESIMQRDVQQALDDWCRMNQRQCNVKKREPLGTLVRLESAEWSHSTYRHFISLSPSRYLLYVATHPHLGKAHLNPLREAHFDNALNGLKNGECLELPSTFALHMAVVSQDKYLLLRRRASNTELYPSAWEAGIGEFMHGPADTFGPEYESGPHHAQFPHFTEDGLPDLFLFLKNAIAEELGYHEARQDDFRVYGFAVEYETLAPKLLVVYNANCTIAALLESARQAKDRASDLSSLELTPHAIAEACSNARYPSWGPTSKLVMLLALRQDFMTNGKGDAASAITRLVDCFEPKKELADPWKIDE